MADGTTPNDRKGLSYFFCNLGKDLNVFFTIANQIKGDIGLRGVFYCVVHGAPHM